MYEIARVNLDNEMDLILAHKRSMKLAELAGLSLPAQTSFATAVSEVARNTIESGKSGCLILNVESDQREKYIVATLNDSDPNSRSREGLEYAKKLVNKYQVSTKGAETSIELFYHISPVARLDIHRIDEWRSLFRNEPIVSPYEELKRKNEQLQELSDRLKKSEDQYKTLTNTLPLIIFTLDMEGHLLYANEWLRRYTGESIDSMNASRWKSVVHEEDYDAFAVLLNNKLTRGASTIRTQIRLKQKAGSDHLWHQFSLTPFENEKKELQYWIGYLVDIHAQKIYEETLKDNIELKHTQKLLQENQLTMENYIEELNRSNRELQQFAFVASHDLQEPVRKLLYYSDYLLQRYTGEIDSKGTEYLRSMQQAAQRMRTLIQDLLLFSQINKEKIEFRKVDLNKVAADALQDLEISIEENGAQIHIDPLPVIEGDERMMRQLFENLISNSIKYSKPGVAPKLEVSYQQRNGEALISFKDNGIGFDEKYLPQMFTLFQRLHSRENYEGTGLGLAICRRIVEMHKGRIWAEGKENEGATFYISLPMENPEP